MMMDNAKLNDAIRVVRDSGLDHLFGGFTEIKALQDIDDAEMVKTVRLLCGEDIAAMYEQFLKEDAEDED